MTARSENGQFKVKMVKVKRVKVKTVKASETTRDLRTVVRLALALR